jgi:ABC-type sugar transport system ATPase subunit
LAQLRVENLTKQFGPHKAVDAVDFEVGDGEFIDLLGPSGSGKTTILRMIAGLESPSSGSIYIDNEVVNDLSPRQRDIAMVFQNYALYPHMKVYDNIALPLKVRKLDEKEIAKSVRATAELLQISDILNKKPSQISGGEQQRVAIARTLMQNPAIILADEPVSSLDPKLSRVILDILKRVCIEDGITALVSLHTLDLTKEYADRIVGLKGGRVFFDGPTSNLSEDIVETVYQG